MKTNIITNNTNMKNEVNRTFMVKKNVVKYLCAVLLLIVTSTRAWATTETLSFNTSDCVWGFNQGGAAYANGTYSAYGLSLYGDHVKYSYYNGDYSGLLIQYTSKGNHDANGYIVLPDFGATITQISVYTYSGSGSRTQYVNLFIDGVAQTEKTLTGTNSATPATWSGLNISSGTEVKIVNTSSNQELHIQRIEITHNGSQVGSNVADDGKPTLSTIVSPADAGTITLSNNLPAANATVDITATPNSGYSFTGWRAQTKYSCTGSFSDYYGIEDSEDPTTSLTMPNSTTAITVLTAVFEETVCSNEPVISFTNDEIKRKFNASAGIYQAASITGKGAGQTLAYSSSNTSIATINSSTGSVTLTGALGSTTITASVLENGDYCAAEASYTLTVEGYDVTFNVTSCASNIPSGLTNQKGSVTLPTGVTLDGYQFAGWTTDGSYSGSSTPPSLEGASINVTSDVDLYAVWEKVSSKFIKMEKNTAISEGDYVFCTNYTGSAVIMTNNYDNKYRMMTDGTTYTFDDDGNLSCNEVDYIWHISGSTGNWVVYNASSHSYLSANNGTTSSDDRQMRLKDNTSTDFEKWIIAQSDANTVPYQIRNKGRVAANASDNGLNVSSGKIGYYANTGSLFMFKRTSTSNAYTINPDCDAAEYMVTIKLNSAPEGTVASASATGATWSSPVLSPVLARASVSINVSPGTGYTFDHWEVTSGGVSLNSASTTASNSFDMPSANVVLTPVFNAATYTITYKDNGNVAYSGSTPPSPATYTYGIGADLPEVSKSGFVFMGWFAETDCSGTRVNTISTTDYGDKTFYALWMQLTDYRAWCPEPEVHLTGDNVYVTSTNGKSIMAVNTLTLNAINLVPGSTVRLSTPASSGIMFSKEGVKYNATTTTIDFTADEGGDITDATVYVHYYPTTAGSGTPADVTVTAEYQTNTDYYSTKDVHVRNMPSAFAIAIKQGSNWFALPANMSGTATNPAGVLLNVDESSWTAKGPSTLAYELWPVKSTTADADRYADYGEKVRFSGNSNKGLWASTAVSGNTLNNNAAISGIGTGSATTNYEWNISTSTDGSTWKYTLKMEDQSNFLNYYNSSVWGSYASGVSDIYLIPLTVVETANMAVMEWGESEVALKCAANTTLSKVTIDGTEVSPKPSLTQICGDIYKITGGGMPNLSTLATYAMKQMVIEVSESSTDKQFVTTIPFILTSSNSPSAEPKTAIDLRNYAEGGSQDAKNKVISVVDVVIRNGARLDVTTAEGNAMACKFNDLYIYPGGKIHINTNDIGLSNVYMRGGFSWLDPSKDYRLPQMLVESGRTISGIGTAGHGVYYDLYLDNAMYYMTAFPKDVLLNDVTNEEGTADWTGWVKGYSGEGRTLNPKESGWKYAWEISPGTTLYRGRGYEIAIKPRYKGAMNGRTIGILRFPLLKGTAWSDEATPDITVTAWGIDDANVSANNKGWNYIGNPFFSSFRNTDENGKFGANMEIRNLQEHIENGQWNGKYDWVTDATVKYITVPDKMVENYTDIRAKNYEIEAFFPFFIQASATGSLTFTGSKILRAPAFNRATVPAREVDIDFILAYDDEVFDHAGLTVGNDYSEEFDMDDKEKTIANENYLKVYTMVGEYRTAFNSLPEAVAELPIPVGYIAPKEGSYEFTLDEGDYSEVEHVWLTDYLTSMTVDLLDDSYSFHTEKGANDTRFAINVFLSPQKEDSATGLEGINTEDNHPLKFLYRDQMYILLNGVLYDAMGKRVSEINK